MYSLRNSWTSSFTCPHIADPDAVFTALFECCRVSDMMSQKFACAFRPERLDVDLERCLVSSLAQVRITHAVTQHALVSVTI